MSIPLPARVPARSPFSIFRSAGAYRAALPACARGRARAHADMHKAQPA
ncbi:hypothetical protein [Komagataeibacter sp. FNDCR2]|nr:hypothetical protein [Komagataeibacter sp. FNDCR2]MCE2576239.1 hypothetical protein [Komagataeibacter sp. FNDCR2]